MSKAIIDEQNLTDIADAIRTKNGSADTYTPSEMATAITDLPTPTPVTKGLVFSDYDSDGYPTKAEFVGTWTEIPANFCYYLFTYFGKNITSITIPNTVTKLNNQTFRFCAALTSFAFPASLTTLSTNCCANCTAVASVTFNGDVPNLPQSAFASNTATTLYDFSNHTGAIPTLYNVASLGHANGCVIKVPSALLSTWQTTGNWASLTGVVWQGV